MEIIPVLQETLWALPGCITTMMMMTMMMMTVMVMMMVIMVIRRFIEVHGRPSPVKFLPAEANPYEVNLRQDVDDNTFHISIGAHL